MRVAIAGGTGTVGRFLAQRLQDAGHEPVVLARAHGVDLVRGADIDLGGVACVVDVTGIRTLSARRSRRFFTAVTANLLAAERAAGVGHHVALSIVGAAGAPYGYYAGKAAQERAVRAGGVPWTILRSTQFFEFAAQTAVPAGRMLLHPVMRSRPVAADTVAARLVELVDAGPSGAVGDLAGPEEVRMADVLRAALAARGDTRRVAEFRLPGGFGRAVRDGRTLPSSDADLRGPGLAAWAEAQA